MSQREEETRTPLGFFQSVVDVFCEEDKSAEKAWLHIISEPRFVFCEIDLFDEPDNEGYVAEVRTFQKGLLHSRHKTRPGDTFRSSHTMNIKGHKRIEKDSPIFPIEFEYAGETYYLRATKNDKLILTK